MKTIFITAFNPFISRNILSTDAFNFLKANSDIKIIILVPDYKVDYFVKRYSDNRISIEGIDSISFSRQDTLFRFLGSVLADSRTLLIHNRERYWEKGKVLKFLISIVFLKFFSHLGFIKRAVRLADLWTINYRPIVKYFEKYQPDLIFATDIFNDYDIKFLAAAKKFKKGTVGMIRSWDNFTTKGFFRVKPDKLIVHNEIIHDEAMRFGGMRPRDIFISGIPQFDHYFTGVRTSREAFFKKINLNPSQKLILFSPNGKRFWDIDWHFMEILKNSGYQILIRLTPNDEVSLDGFIPNNKCFIDKPGYQFKPGISRDQELDIADLNWLADCLANCDVAVVGGATIGIDAAIFKKPVILIGFDGLEKRPYMKSVARWLDFNHFRMVYESGSFKLAKSPEDLLRKIEFY